MNAAERTRLAESNRLTTCLRPGCERPFAVCGGCDRGRRYCSDVCSSEARRAKQRVAGARYQATERGRRQHAERQARYLERRRVTHQSSSAVSTNPGDEPIPAGGDAEHLNALDRDTARPPAAPSPRPPRSPSRTEGAAAASVLTPRRRSWRPLPFCACCGRDAVFLRLVPLNGCGSRRP
jgi:hypothetical protein